MPLIASAVLVFAAGLLIGFGGFLFPGLALATCLLLWAVIAGRRTIASLILLCAAGVLVATASARGADACAELLLARKGWSALLHGDASPGGFVQATITDVVDGCSTAAGIAIVSGSASAGSVVHVQGSPLRGERSIVIQRASIQPARGGSPLIRLRTAAGHAIDRYFGERAPMVRALLIADSRDLDRNLRDEFADSGLVHMLSVSGLHVGIIAAAVLLLLRAAGVSLVGATAGAAALTIIYVLVIGAPAPAVRAGVMVLVLAACRIMQRPTSPWAVLAIGALVPLMSPAVILSLGYQLSVTGMVGLICAGRLMGRLSIVEEGGWRATIAGTVFATLLASIATAPIIAWHFGRISVIAPLTNLLAAPIMILLQPLLFLALILAPIPGVAAFLADASIPLIFSFEQIAHIGARPRWSSVDVAPSLLTAFLAALAALGVLVAAAGRRPRRWLMLSAVTVTCVIWIPALSLPQLAGSGRLEIHLIDVGQGDAVAVRLPDRSWILFDAGRSWNGGDAGRRQVIPYLRRFGGKLQAFVLSHPHSDHVGGAASVLRWLRPDVFFDAAYVAANSDYLAALQQARAHGIEWRRVKPGTTFTFGGATLEFLAPDSAWTAELDDPNEASTVAKVRFGSVSMLLTGDAEKSEEEWLVHHQSGRLRANILKVAHHGSRTSTSAAFLAAVRPSVALISVGAANRYGHPNDSVLSSLAGAGALVLRTDQHGSVVVSTDGRTIWVEAMGDRWMETARQ